MKKNSFLLFMSCFATCLNAQLGFGIVGGEDAYQRYVNPISKSDTNSGRSSGCIVLNPLLGLRLWAGGENISFSMEGQVNWGMAAFCYQEYKGLGALAFPLIGKINFWGLSGFAQDGDVGFSIGGGMQFSKTELYGLTKSFRDNTSRSFFSAYFFQVDFGFKKGEKDMSFYIRYGAGAPGAYIFNIGYVRDINFLE